MEVQQNGERIVQRGQSNEQNGQHLHRRSLYTPRLRTITANTYTSPARRQGLQRDVQRRTRGPGPPSSIIFRWQMRAGKCLLLASLRSVEAATLHEVGVRSSTKGGVLVPHADGGLCAVR